MESFSQLLQIFFLYVFTNLQVKWEQTLLVDQVKEWEYLWLTEVLIQHTLHAKTNTKEKCPAE
jgi:ABC-type uncharacterized transport system fused permease/ATPase subunit